MKAAWIAGGIVLVAACILLAAHRSPKRIDDKRFVGIWFAPNEARGIRFMADGTATIVSDKGVDECCNRPFDWWADEQNQLHYFVQDEDASTWATAPYSFEGNDRLHFGQSLMVGPVGTDLERKKP